MEKPFILSLFYCHFYRTLGQEKVKKGCFLAHPSRRTPLPHCSLRCGSDGLTQPLESCEIAHLGMFTWEVTFGECLRKKHQKKRQRSFLDNKLYFKEVFWIINFKGSSFCH